MMESAVQPAQIVSTIGSHLDHDVSKVVGNSSLTSYRLQNVHITKVACKVRKWHDSILRFVSTYQAYGIKDEQKLPVTQREVWVVH